MMSTSVWEWTACLVLVATGCAQVHDRADARPIGADAAVAVDLAGLVHGGSRLRARWWVSEDGTRAFAGFYDRELETECRFDFAADGELRCLPMGGYVADELFTDADCSMPATAVYTECPPAFALRPLGDALCRLDDTYGLAQQVFAVGDAVLEAFSRSDGTCREAPPRGERRFRRITRIPPETLARVTTSVEGDARLRAIVARTGDGASALVGMVDSARDAACAFDDGANGISVCLPSRTYITFRNSACTDPVATVFADDGVCPPPIVAVDWGYARGEECSSPRIYELLGQTRVSQLYGSQFDLSCEPASGTGFDVYAVSEAPPDFLVWVTEQHPGDGRLRPMRWADGDGQLWPAPREQAFWDAELETGCSPGRLADGELACVPRVRLTNLTLYADSDCTELAHDMGWVYCEVDEYVFTTSPAGATCGEVPRIASVRPVLDEVRTAYRRELGVCVPASVTGPVHRLGEPIEHRLARLSLVVD